MIHDAFGVAIQVTGSLIVVLLVVLVLLVVEALRSGIGDHWTEYQLARWFEDAAVGGRRLSDSQMQSLAALSPGLHGPRHPGSDEGLLDAWMRDPEVARASLRSLALELGRRAAYRQGAALSMGRSLRGYAWRWRIARAVNVVDTVREALRWLVRAATVDRRFVASNALTGWVAGAGTILFAAVTTTPWANSALQVAGDVGTVAGMLAFAFCLLSPTLPAGIDGTRRLGDESPLVLLSGAVAIALLVGELVLLQAGVVGDLLSGVSTRFDVPDDWSAALGLVLVEATLLFGLRNTVGWARAGHVRLSVRVDAAAATIMVVGLMVIVPLSVVSVDPGAVQVVAVVTVSAMVVLLLAGGLVRLGEVTVAARRLAAEGRPVSRKGHRWWSLFLSVTFCFGLGVVGGGLVPADDGRLWLTLQALQLLAFLTAIVMTILGIAYSRRVRRAEERALLPDRSEPGPG